MITVISATFTSRKPHVEKLRENSDVDLITVMCSYFAIGRRDWISAFQTVTAIVLCIVPSLGILILYRQAYANLKADEVHFAKFSSNVGNGC